MNPLELLKEQARRSLERKRYAAAQQYLSDSRVILVTAERQADDVAFAWSIDGSDASEEIAEREMRRDKHLGRAFYWMST